MHAEPASKNPPPAARASAWSLRPARPTDAVAWHALQQTIYQEGHAFVGDGPQAPAALAGQLRTLRPSDGMVVMAVSPSGDLIGWVEAYRGGGRRLAHVATLTVAVAAAWRRQGLGKALMAEVEDWGRRHGLHKLQLRVRAGNTVAIALYQRLGYEVEGVLRDQVASVSQLDRFEDEWVMALPLLGPKPSRDQGGDQP